MRSDKSFRSKLGFRFVDRRSMSGLVYAAKRISSMVHTRATILMYARVRAALSEEK